ncbi:MAG: TolC family protein [Planctomycetota bacterium]
MCLFNYKTVFIQILIGVTLITCACTSDEYLEEADEEVYDIILEKQQAVLGETRSFSIAESEDLETVRNHVEEIRAESGPGEAADEKPAGENQALDPFIEEMLEGVDADHLLKLNLTDCLKIAFKTNRDFKQEKEDLYIDALNLTWQRHLWTPRFSGSVSGEAKRLEDSERYISSDAQFGMTQLLASGGEVGLSIANNLLRVYSGGSTKTASSLLSFNFFQPLWRGFGTLVAKENLTQAERNVAYSIRSYERFRRSLAVDIATSYYDVLQQMDTVKNEYNNYQNLILNRERSALMAQAGRLPEFQVDQARQTELSARNRWLKAEEQFDRLLDRFKFDLGIPTDTPLELDSEDLSELSGKELVHPTIDLQKAIEYALSYRLDLQNTKDRVDDARRRVIVAEDGLGADLDFNFEYTLGTEAPAKPLKFQPRRPEYGASLDLNLPLERTQERNTFRQAFIDLERQKRSLSQLKDSILQTIRQAYRALNQAKESYEIQKLSLTLAEKRVESTDLLLQAGRADTRDYLESQESLLSAQNAVTGALIEHTVAKLNFLVEIESLDVDATGLIQTLEERLDFIEAHALEYKGPDTDE